MVLETRHPAVESISLLTPDPLRWTQEFWEHFWERVDQSVVDGCHEWMGFRLRKGYGQLSHNGKLRRAHQLAWEMSTGLEIPDGMLVCHSCDNPPCCFPPHLSLGTAFDNQSDRIAKGRHRPLNLEQTAPSTSDHWLLGEAHPRAKLTEVGVRYIRREFAKGTYIKDLAKAFGVNKETISDVVKGRTWRHVK